MPGSVFKAHVESIGWGVSQNSVDPNTGLPTIKNATGWVRDPQRFPVRLIVDETPPRGSVRVGSQVNVVVYAGNNPVTDALGRGIHSPHLHPDLCQLMLPPPQAALSRQRRIGLRVALAVAAGFT